MPGSEYLPDYRRKMPSGGTDMNRFPPSAGNTYRDNMYMGGGGFEDYRRGQHPAGYPDPYQQRPAYDPRGYAPMRRDVANRSFSQFDRTDHVPPRPQQRSRTPGPEFMRRSPDRDDPYFQPGANDLRSKTPTPSDAPYRQHNISGTPDFIPASRYQAPPTAPHGTAPHGRPNGAVPNHLGNTRPMSNPDLAEMYTGKDEYGVPTQQTRLPSSQSHTGALSALAPATHHAPYANSFTSGGHQLSPASQGKMSNVTRKQTTSFEHEEPTPGNVSRGRGDIWGGGDSGSDVLNHSRSPAHSFDCDDCSVDMTVTLRRHENGFGFRIVGGTEEASQVREREYFLTFLNYRSPPCSNGPAFIFMCHTLVFELHDRTYRQSNRPKYIALALE